MVVAEDISAGGATLETDSQKRLCSEGVDCIQALTLGQDLVPVADHVPCFCRAQPAVVIPFDLMLFFPSARSVPSTGSSFHVSRGDRLSGFIMMAVMGRRYSTPRTCGKAVAGSQTRGVDMQSSRGCGIMRPRRQCSFILARCKDQPAFGRLGYKAMETTSNNLRAGLHTMNGGELLTRHAKVEHIVIFDHI